MNETLARSTRTALQASVGGAVVQVVVWIVNAAAGVDIPGEVQAAFTVIVTYLLSLTQNWMEERGTIRSFLKE